MFIKQVKEKIEYLRTQDINFEIDGARDHKYQFGSIVPSSQIQEFEVENNLTLPDHYRKFLLEIGNGGPGPSYGLRKIDFRTPTDFRLAGDPLIDFSKKFPYQSKWNETWIDDVDWENGEKPDDLLHQKYWSTEHIHGAFPICHYGHGDCFLLIVKGEQAGKIWFDARGSYGGITPEIIAGRPVSFSTWYSQWLDQSIRHLKNQKS